MVDKAKVSFSFIFLWLLMCSIFMRFIFAEPIILNDEPRADLYSLYLKEGTGLIKRGLYEEAIKRLREAVKNNPALPGAHNNLGVAYACKADYAAAIEEFKKSLEKEISDYAEIINYNLSVAYCYAGLLEEAGKFAEKINNSKLRASVFTVISVKKIGADASFSFAASSFPPDTIALAPMPKSEKAKELLKEKTVDKIYLAENFPLFFLYHSPLSYLNLAISFFEKQDFTQAELLLDNAYNTLKENKDNQEYLDKIALVGIYFYRGQINLTEKNYVYALENFKQATEIFPDWLIFNQYLGITYYLLNHYQEAKNEFNKVIASVHAESEMAKAAEEYLKRIEEAGKGNENFVEVEASRQDMEEIRALVARSKQAYEKHDLKALIDCFDTSLPWFSGFSEMLLKEFQAYPYICIYSKELELKILQHPQGGLGGYLETEFLFISYGNTGNIITDNINSEYVMRYILGKRPGQEHWKILEWQQTGKDDFKHYMTGIKFLNAGDIEQAILEFKKAIEINPNYSVAYSRLSDLYFSKREIDKAIQYVKEAVRIRPEVAYYHFSLGCLYSAKQDKELAHSEFLKVKEIDPLFPEIHDYVQRSQ